MTMVQTATGPIDADQLGFCLMHEHVQVSSPAMHQQYPELFDRESVTERAVARLRTAYEAGVRSVVDLTPMDLGRDVRLIRDVSDRSGVQIVVATGFYYSPPFYFWMRPTSEIVDFLISEIEDGIAGSGIRAGVIKCATNGDVDPLAERVLRACARAHRATGVPISTHTEATLRDGLKQQEIFLEEGVDLSCTVIGHSDDSPDDGYIESLLRAGSWVGLDRFGVETPRTSSERIDRFVRLLNDGYAGRVVISHDACGYMQWASDLDRIDALAPRWRFSHIADEVIPTLKAAGIGDEAVRRVTVDNPREILSGRAPY